MANIALLPGGFKPPHAGHYAVAKYLSQKSGAEVLVRVGAKERDNITQDMSIDIWELYGVNAEPASSDSPIADVFKYVEEKATEKDTIYVGTGEKDFPRFKVLTDPSFKPENYEKYNPKGIKVIEIPIPPQAGGVSGTKMREFVMNDQKDQFQKFLPDHVDKDKVWNIVIGLNEDFYDPRNKYYDFAKSSEYKAGMPNGHKDDIPRAYKYKRGGMYTGGGMGFGGMYESRGGESELHIYDFDDTIAQVKANIRATITSPKGDYEKVLDIPSDKFPEISKEMETKFSMMNFDYDFSEFEKQIEDAIISSEVLNKLKSSLSNPSVQTTILTARTIGHPVTKFLQSIGLDAYVVPLGLQVGGERVTGQDKADWIEKKIKTKKSIKKIYFIDDSAENRKAVYTLRDNYPEIEFKIETPPIIKEMGGTMTKQEKAKHAKNMKRLSKDMSNLKGNNYGGGGYKVPDYVKGTLTRKLYEEMSVSDVDAIEDFADKKLNPVDVDLTSNHFFDRLNDPRNKKDISGAELIGFFKRLSKKKKEFVEFLTKYKEVVATDNRTNINIPFMKLANKAIAKTIMRKKNFHTSGPKMSIGEDGTPAGTGEMYVYDERSLTDKEEKNKEKIVKGLKGRKNLDKSDMYAIATAQAKKMKETKLFSQEWWKQHLTEVLLTEGGAAGHMNHPFDDRDLTFAEMKELVHLSLQGKLNIEADVTEKTDGQNLAVTYKNGKVGAARNKATIREPMDINAVASKFEGRGDIEKAFTFSMRDLESALKNLDPKTLNNIFQNGKRFLNIEIIYPATKNVITYGPKAYIQFHGVDEYNLETATKGDSFPEFAPQLQKLIADVNANIQQTFEIIPPKIITTKAVRDFDKKEPNYINRINKLQQEFALQDSDEVVMYHQRWWENRVNNEFPQATDEEKQALVRRWAYFEKKFRLRGIQDEETRQKAIDFDKTNFQKQNKENVYKFEKIFLELGTDVLANINNYLAVNPKESVKELRKDIQNVIKQIQSTNDLEVLNKLKYQLKRIEDMGGFDKLVPSEGIVFIYKGKTYKLTGLFAAVNQLLGLTKYV
jgi:hypothetical protein